MAVMACLLMFSCSTDNNITPARPDIFDNSESVQATLVVEVVDESGNPVSDAVVSLGQETHLTGSDGLAFFVDAAMSLSSYVVVKHDEFFHGSRRFYPSESAINSVRIVLLRSAPIGIIHSDTGGEVAVDNHVTLSFGAASIMNLDGTPYDGIFSVRAQGLPADHPDIYDMMPGDLIGRDNGGNIMGLETYGMVAVELRGESGENLQVAEGSSVEMTMTVPEGLRGRAPSNIPLWYFDEVEGIWIEEGEAVLTDEGYVGNVRHFSFWNCDFPYESVRWGASFVHESGPVSYPLQVCIEIPGSDRPFCRLTDSEGKINGVVAADVELNLSIRDQCGNIVYEDIIGPYLNNTTIGPITIPEINRAKTTISGMLVDCQNIPISSGLVKIDARTGFYFVECDDTGHFTVDVFDLCLESDDYALSAIDLDKFVQSDPINLSQEFLDLSEDTLMLGQILTCGAQASQYVILELGDDMSFFWFEILDVQGGISDQVYTIWAREVVDSTFANGSTFSITLPKESETSIVTGSANVTYWQDGLSYSAGGTHRPDFILLENPKQFYLQGKRQLTYFVEKNSSPLRC